jgi:hypothetical protein
MLSESTIALIAASMVTASLPFYLYGAWIMIDAETVTWGVLTYHLKFIIPGLILNTIPVVTWMIPRLLQQLGGAVALHAVLGLQAYALLAFALTGIVRILQVKRNAGFYDDPLRVGVFGYVGLWFLAWSLGLYLYMTKYVL